MSIVDKIKSFVDKIKADEKQATITFVIEGPQKNVDNLILNVDIVEEHYGVKIDINKTFITGFTTNDD